ncbi:hypothetical protein [Nocardioides sp.]|uniref:hypothetical protein n=1 Tax=Nocardioides sp. TaxID=35761 RepID=UPI0039E4517F
MARPTVFLHVGTRKSATTYLQLGLKASRGALAAEGVQVAALTQSDFKHLVPGLRRWANFGEEQGGRLAVDYLVQQLQRRPGRAQVVSVEALAELPGYVVDDLVTAVTSAGFDVQVIVTARHWGLIIPSEWQQRIKQRGTQTYADFVAAIRDGGDDLFVRRQDLADIARRWGALIPPERVHVIACPPPTRTEGTLLELFCGILGVPTSLITPPSRVVNSSLSLAQAETLRRVNLALGDRLPRRTGGYESGVRNWITRESLTRHKGEKVLLPEGFGSWCAAESRRQVDELRDLGVHLAGRVDDLLASPDVPTGPVEVDDAEVAEVAVLALADLADHRWHQLHPDDEIQDGR